MPEKYIKVLKVRTRARRSAPENALVDVPFIRVTPKKSQVSLGRDALAALGRPVKVLWSTSRKLPEVPPGQAPEALKIPEGVKIRVTAADPDDEGAYVVSYGKLKAADGSEHPRPAGLTTIPGYIRQFLSSRRYWAVAWSQPTEHPRWFEFTFKSTVPTAAVAASIPHVNADSEASSSQGGSR